MTHSKKPTPTSAALLTAIQTGDDERAEQLVPQLTAEDEPLLLTWLTDPDVDLRWWAARALAEWGGPAVVAPLLTQLQDADPTLRAVAIMALGRLHARYPSATHPLLSALSTKLADDDGAVRQVAADTLARCGDEAAPVLAEVLQSNHEGARTRAAYALRKIASLKAAPILFHVLNDANYMVHTYAHEALDEMGLLENILVQLH